MEQKDIKGAVIKVIGVGGGGNNAVNRMLESNNHGIEFIVANTDIQVLNISKAPTKIILGEKVSKGLGAGANPEIGKQAAVESKDTIREALAGSDLVFIAAGMGGGTGTGAAPEIAKIAQESGALTVAIVTKPFRFEGKNRNKFAREGIAELKKYVDSIIIISNDKLLELTGAVPITESFKEADNILKQGVQTITDLIAVPSQINLDFADVKTVMSKKGSALFGIGIGSGANGAVDAANKAINSSLLETSIYGATDAIVNITGGGELTLNDAYDAVDVIQQATGEDLNIVFGMATNPALNDNIIVTIIATGYDEEQNKQPEQPEQPEQPAMRPQTDFFSTNIENNRGRSVRNAEPLQSLEKNENLDSFNFNNATTNFNDVEDDNEFPTFLNKK
jgi:cell division protein FtsZ